MRREATCLLYTSIHTAVIMLKAGCGLHQQFQCLQITGCLALIATLIILAAALALELRQSAPLNDKMKKST